MSKGEQIPVIEEASERKRDMFQVTIRYSEAQERYVSDTIHALGEIPYNPERCDDGRYEETFVTEDYHDLDCMYRLLVAGVLTLYSVESFMEEDHA